MGAPVFLAEVKRDGFPEFIRKHGPLAVEARSGLVVFGPERERVAAVAAALEAPAGGFAGTAFHGRISEAYRSGAGFLICADLSKLTRAAQGIRYVVADKQ